jgi:hypothetical protein
MATGFLVGARCTSTPYASEGSQELRWVSVGGAGRAASMGVSVCTGSGASSASWSATGTLEERPTMWAPGDAELAHQLVAAGSVRSHGVRAF